MVFVSKCLWGKNCKYNGGNNLRTELIKELEGEEIMLICPECEGGLAIPRAPSEIEYGKSGADVIKGNGKVIAKNGSDVTEEFLCGAKKVLELAKKHLPTKIYLKQSSPSCGCGLIYDGTFGGNKKSGNGVTAQLLLEEGFSVEAVD